MADGHSGVLIAVGGIVVTAGGIFMVVTGFEPAAKPTTVWANSWFDLGLGFVILGLVIATIGVVAHFRGEVEGSSAPKAVNAPPAAALPAAVTAEPESPAVNSAEWDALCNPAGPDRAVFELRHRFGDQHTFRDFNLLRCIVTDPDEITTESDGPGRIRQYTPDFPSAPRVRPGRYRSEWKGRASNGRWVDITSGECEVKAGLEIVIEDEKRTPFPGVASILEIDYAITNHDAVPHELRPALRGVNPHPDSSASDPDRLAALRGEHQIRERRQRERPLPARVQPGETVRGVYVASFSWDPRGKFPDYTLVIRTERKTYTARPHGVGEDPLAAWPIG